MGALKRPEYESLETEATPNGAGGAETSSGAVKHNGSINPHQAGPQGVPPSGRVEGAEPATTMPNEILTAADSPSQAASTQTGHELDAFLGKAFDEKPIWTGLWESVRDVFFPPKLPPLELTSQPIPVPDRMAVKTNPWAVGIASGINLTIAAILLFFVGRAVVQKILPPTNLTSIDISDYKAPKAAQLAGGGGGGGNHSILEANKGKLPKIEKDPVVPPQPQTFDKPKIPEVAAIDVQKNIQLPNNPDMPVIGMKSSTNVVLSPGTGSSGGMGTGSGGGLGSGTGNGFGPGTGGNAGGGLYRVGGGVSAPVPLNDVEAEFSDEARRAKYQGICEVALIVDAQGMPQNVHVIRPLGMGLDEKAVEAVRKYRFKPAMKDGKTPVPVMVTVEVNFRLY
jgi:periplasmic protein TonB